jgi:hypothetical protein
MVRVEFAESPLTRAFGATSHREERGEVKK